MIDSTAHRGIGMTSARTRNRLVDRLRAGGIRDERVLERVLAVPRHIFVDEALASRAYEDTALPIGHGQTISQPFIVARMTEALLKGLPGGRILEIGTGCGYQTAVLAPLVDEIYTVERLAPLLTRARQRLRELGIGNVRFRRDDGWAGWPKYGPYHGILVAAAPERVPEALLAQLAPGGRLVLPVGSARRQELMAIVHREDRYEQISLGPVSFVPLVAGA